MFNNPLRGVMPRPPRQKSEKCEIVTERKGDKIKKSIRGNCTPQQLKALAGSEDVEMSG